MNEEEEKLCDETLHNPPTLCEAQWGAALHGGAIHERWMLGQTGKPSQDGSLVSFRTKKKEEEEITGTIFHHTPSPIQTHVVFLGLRTASFD